jgi:hypothetical protein
MGIPHQAVQVREVGCCHRKDLSALVHSPPKKFGLPRGRCDVEPPAGAVAADCRFAASWDQPDGVFCRVMGPPLLQAEGTTRGGGVRSFSQPHGTSRFAGSWDPLRQVTSRAIGK